MPSESASSEVRVRQLQVQTFSPDDHLVFASWNATGRHSRGQWAEAPHKHDKNKSADSNQYRRSKRSVGGL